MPREAEQDPVQPDIHVVRVAPLLLRGQDLRPPSISK